MPYVKGALAALFFLSASTFAQQFTFSAVGGTNVTNNFPVTEYRTPADAYGNPESLFRYKSGGRSLILGGAVEARLTERFSFEASLLHRPMKNEIHFEEFPVGGTATKSVNTNTAVRVWQFPLLMKWRLGRMGGMEPFVAGGMSFRTQENASAVEPSQRGFTAGTGVTFAWKRLRVSPTLRYTRWAREQIWPRYATKPDQVEFLTSFGVGTGGGPDGALSLGRVTFGMVAGIPLTSGFATPRALWEWPKIDERFRYSVGLALEGRINERWSVEVNGIYRPLRVKGTSPDRRTLHSVLTWQVPLLLKYRWREEGWRPFVSVGPSFRLSGNLNGASPSLFGGTIGVGLEKKLGGRVTMAPTFRYTRWRQERPFLRTNQNTAEVLVGFSF